MSEIFIAAMILASSMGTWEFDCAPGGFTRTVICVSDDEVIVVCIDDICTTEDGTYSVADIKRAMDGATKR